MTLGKSKKFIKQLNRKKKTDSFLKKQWFSLRGPAVFEKSFLGQTIANKSVSRFKSEDSLRGRIVETNLEELCPSVPDAADKVFKFKVPTNGAEMGAITTTQCLAVFDGFRTTTHKRRSIVKKHQTLIETFCKVTIADTHTLYFKIVCNTWSDPAPKQRNRTSHVKKRIIKRIRRHIQRTITDITSRKDINAIMNLLANGELEEKMRKCATLVIPVKDMLIEKVKVVSLGETQGETTFKNQHKVK
eukprot:GAHX01000026.1.p1 GENE.GAHX01000026.1~~GAHX01000026.1.p1  ORF type:complete len:245 (-),score=40.50 GAHX01000026.1:42-776(-)